MILLHALMTANYSRVAMISVGDSTVSCIACQVKSCNKELLYVRRFAMRSIEVLRFSSQEVRDGVAKGRDDSRGRSEL
jgi:hypothetical protein